MSEAPRDAEAVYLGLTARLEEQYIANLAFLADRGADGSTVRDAFLDAADAVAGLSPDERAAKVAVARARAAASMPALTPLPGPRGPSPAAPFGGLVPHAPAGVPRVPGRFGGLGDPAPRTPAPRGPAPVGGQRPFAPRAGCAFAPPVTPPFLPEVHCTQLSVTVSVSLWLSDVASVAIAMSPSGLPVAKVTLTMYHGAPRSFGLQLGGAVARAHGAPRPASSLVMLTFAKPSREVVWPEFEPLAVPFALSAAAQAYGWDAAPAPAALVMAAPAPPLTPGAPAPAPTLVTPAATAPAPPLTPGALAPALAPDDDGVEMTVMTPEQLKKRRFDEALANGDVIEIPSDDDEAPQVAPDAATQARLDAAATQRRQIDERKRQRTTSNGHAVAAHYIRSHRGNLVTALKAHCRSYGLKVSGRKNELVARLALCVGLQVFDRPGTRREGGRVAALANDLDGFVRAHSTATVVPGNLLASIRRGPADY